MSIPAWLPKWKNEPVLLIAAGPSAKRETAVRARALGWRVCVVNRSWELAPWADLMYGADFAFWAHYKGVPDFHGLKITSHQGVTAGKPFTDVRQSLAFVNQHGIRCITVGLKGEISWDGEPLGHGGNSGFQLLNIALLTGANPIMLEGYDCTAGHWHSEYDKPLGRGPENRKHWAETLDKAAAGIRRRGRTVIDLSTKGRLTAYRKMDIDEACWFTMGAPTQHGAIEERESMAKEDDMIMELEKRIERLRARKPTAKTAKMIAKREAMIAELRSASEEPKPEEPVIMAGTTPLGPPEKS